MWRLPAAVTRRAASASAAAFSSSAAAFSSSAAAFSSSAAAFSSSSAAAVAAAEAAAHRAPPPSPARERALVDGFRRVVDAHAPKDGKGVVIATAWLATDNVIVALLRTHFPELLAGAGLLAIDTLHLPPTTHAVAEAVQAAYGKRATILKPAGVSTTAEFVAKYGDAEAMNHADFDYASKVEPYSRGLAALGKQVLVTGRRMDQAAQRTALDEWEAPTRTLNPLAAWTWADVTAFVDAHGVPVNAGHNVVFRADAPVDAAHRHRPNVPWTKFDLGKPYWRATEAELRGAPPAAHVYVWKSFGDAHTSVPVAPAESERAGRFVRTGNTECGIHTRTTQAGAPHGGVLVDRMVRDPAAAAALVARASHTVALTDRQVCDVELIVNGGFSPLTGFHTKKEYDAVVEHGRLPEAQVWPMPVTLDVDGPVAAAVQEGDAVALTWAGETVAVLEVASAWTPDKTVEARHVFGTASLEHPGVADLALARGRRYLGGPLHGLARPRRAMPCPSPAEVRATLPPAGTPVVAFQCRNPIHRAHYELVRRVLDDVPGCAVLIHPTVGPTQPGDIDPAARVATYLALEKEVGNPRIKWAFLPFNMRMAGPREAVQHMIVRKNFGATHFIVGRDMAGTKSTATGVDFYGPYDAQVAAKARAKELAMGVVAYEAMVYTDRGFETEGAAKAAGLKTHKLSGTEFRRLLRAGEPIPAWFSFESVIRALREHEAAEDAAQGA
jgi:sulfate adenylyltransferase